MGVAGRVTGATTNSYGVVTMSDDDGADAVRRLCLQVLMDGANSHSHQSDYHTDSLNSPTALTAAVVANDNEGKATNKRVTGSHPLVLSTTTYYDVNADPDPYPMLDDVNASAYVI